MENPFLDYGKIISGKRFIGRQREIDIIQNRVLKTSFGNIAIQGVPRIGKSSLAWNALMVDQVKLEVESNIFVVRINVGTLSSSEDFFHRLARELLKRVKKNKYFKNSYLLEIYNEFKRTNNIVEKLEFLEEYFQVLRELNYRVIYILDEFDSVRNYLGVSDFQYLRELTYNPNIEICLVTISRRSIKELEPSMGTLSNFYQTFTDLYLGMFSPSDLEMYWETFFHEGLKLEEEDKKEILKFSGNHPYLLDLFNYHLFINPIKNIKSQIVATKKNINLTILNNYFSILELLREEDLDTKIMQVIVGPVIDISRGDVEKLERYDLIKVSKQKFIQSEESPIAGYDAFSVDFEQYLHMIYREIPIWDLWSKTEIKLRSIVLKWLKERYGDNWVDKYRKLPKKEGYIKKLEHMQEREKNSFPETYSQNLLDFTYPADLFNYFMTVEWSWFEKIFRGQKNFWKLKFDLLAKIRNPLAHNKDNLLKDFERDDAKGFCKEILERIDKWEQQVGSIS